jgi:hypothetical protein
VECASIACSIRRIPAPEAVAGIDVGENFLDLATLRAGILTQTRIPLAGIEPDPIALLRRRLQEACPMIGPGWLAAIDSPRWPIDLDAASDAPRPRPKPPRTREIDRMLRAIARQCRPPIPFALFPTPPLANFAAQAAIAQPHLRAAFLRLFPGTAVDGGLPPAAGQRFTRFMLAGFLTFRALETVGAQAVEAYPDWQFRLWSAAPVVSKRLRRAALQSRQAILAHVSKALKLSAPLSAGTLDQADAAILATTAFMAARRGTLALLEHAQEGAFLMAVPYGFPLPP